MVCIVEHKKTAGVLRFIAYRLTFRNSYYTSIPPQLLIVYSPHHAQIKIMHAPVLGNLHNAPAHIHPEGQLAIRVAHGDIAAFRPALPQRRVVYPTNCFRRVRNIF